MSPLSLFRRSRLRGGPAAPAPVDHHPAVAEASLHLDLHDQATHAAHAQLDAFWDTGLPGDYEAAQHALTDAVYALGRCRVALARTQRSTP